MSATRMDPSEAKLMPAGFLNWPCPVPEVPKDPKIVPSGPTSLTFRSGIYDGQGYQDFDQAKLFEHVAHSGYQGDTARQSSKPSSISRARSKGRLK